MKTTNMTFIEAGKMGIAGAIFASPSVYDGAHHAIKDDCLMIERNGLWEMQDVTPAHILATDWEIVGGGE